jgi:hypothetical protein
MPVDFNIDGQYKVNGVPLTGTSNPSVITLSVAGGTPVTGTLLNTISQSLIIPANTFTPEGMLEFLVRYRKTGSAGTMTCRVYLNTSPTLTGATQIGGYVNGSSSLFFQGIRTGRVKSNVLTLWPSSANVFLDYTTSGAAKTSVTFNTSVDNYLLFTVQLFNVADSTVVNIARAVIYS